MVFLHGQYGCLFGYCIYNFKQAIINFFNHHNNLVSPFSLIAEIRKFYHQHLARAIWMDYFFVFNSFGYYLWRPIICYITVVGVSCSFCRIFVCYNVIELFQCNKHLYRFFKSHWKWINRRWHLNGRNWYAEAFIWWAPSEFDWISCIVKFVVHDEFSLGDWYKNNSWEFSAQILSCNPFEDLYSGLYL